MAWYYLPLQKPQRGARGGDRKDDRPIWQPNHNSHHFWLVDLEEEEKD